MIKQIGGINILSTNENIVNNLKYLGLDLEKLPNSIKEFEPLDYRPSKFNDEHNYKVYKYVDIKDIISIKFNASSVEISKQGTDMKISIKLVKENLLTFSEAYDIFESQKGSSDT